MTDICEMSGEQLIVRAESPLDTDRNLCAFLERAAELAEDFDPALSLLFSVLAEEPPEIAANWAPALDELKGKLHPDTDGPTLAEAASKALAQWKED